MTIYPVIDTNVVIDALRHKRSAQAGILDAMIHGDIVFVASTALTKEYQWALTNLALLENNGISQRTADNILCALLRNAFVTGSFAWSDTAPTCPDPGDQFLWNLLTERVNLILVTSDKLLQRDEVMRERVLSPKAFEDRYWHQHCGNDNRNWNQHPANKTNQLEIQNETALRELRSCQAKFRLNHGQPTNHDSNSPSTDRAAYF